MYPGELVFVPAPNPQKEDDGVLLCLVLDANPNADHFLAILDATSLCEIARTSVPREQGQIPPTIHGLFVFE